MAKPTMWQTTPELDRGIAEWEHEWHNGDRSVCKALAVQLVEQHYPAALRDALERFTQEQLVKLIDAARGELKWGDGVQRAFPEREPLISVFIMAKFEPQQIHGSANLGAASPQILRAAAEALERGRK